jgi:hypothetical protein
MDNESELELDPEPELERCRMQQHHAEWGLLGAGFVCVVKMGA